MKYHKKVILFTPAAVLPQRWTFFDFLLVGTNPIEDWYQGLSELEQDSFNALLKVNQKTEVPLNWQGSKALKGECKKHSIWEWRFNPDGVQQRILGIAGKKRKEAIFLIGCYHKGSVYTPHDALDTAITRAKLYDAGKASVVERKITTSI